MLCLLASKPKASEVMSKCPNTILHCPSLEYQTIKVAFVRHEYRGNGVRRRQYHVIDAELTYRLTRCLLCGFEALHPNGFYTAHVRVLKRWRCHNCYHTVSAKTPLVQPNHTIAAHMTERIMKLAHERLPVKTIARIIGISASSVQRIIDQNLKLRPARRLPTRLCFDEFRSTHGMMSFIWFWCKVEIKRRSK